MFNKMNLLYLGFLLLLICGHFVYVSSEQSCETNDLQALMVRLQQLKTDTETKIMDLENKLAESKVDGKWTDWSDWTSCDATCGNGTQTRTRSCTNPAPAHGGASCTGENVQNEKCRKKLCPVIDGGWTNWGVWSTCTVTCGGGTQIRTRTCTNPKPSDLGEYCIGDAIHVQSCSQERCLVVGIWTIWSDWSSCDVTCDNGTQTRSRSCTNPTPALGDTGCTGESVQNEKCSKQLCPVIDGGWTNWGVWSTCTVTCGGGTQLRTRTCTNPKPSDLGEYCIGDPIHIQSCSQEICSRMETFHLNNVIDGGWTTWGTWSTCTVTCGGGTQIRTRTCANPKPSELGEYCSGDRIHIQSCSQTECSPIASAFSVYNPNTYSSFDGTSKLTFNSTIYQHGGDFDTSTGTFTCSVPGTYHFSVTLVKKRASTRVDQVYCHLYKSGSDLININIDPTDDETDNGSAAISQSIVTHLNKGNTVYLTRCSNPPSTYMESWSSFTGFLLYPDN